MSDGSKIRDAIDSENVRGLLLLNGGAVVALLAFLPTLMDNPDFDPMTWAVLGAMLVFQLGLVFAVLHNRLRRICSRHHERSDPPRPCRLLGVRSPCACFASTVCLWLSLIAFVSGGVMVVAGAARVLHHAEASEARGAAMPARIFAAPRSIGAGFYLNSIRSIFPPVSSAVR